MEIRQLEHFVAVAEQQHFTRAAEALSISQSGLSASIRALERELQASLFVRTTRRVELTEAGRALLAESRRTLCSAAAARDAVAAVRGLTGGTLTLGAEHFAGAAEVPRLLARFRATYPGVEIALRQGGSSWLLAELSRGRLDAAVVSPPALAHSGVDLRPLASEPMVVVVPPGHRLAARDRAALQELAGEAFVDLHAEWGARVAAERAFAAAGVQRRVALEVDDADTLRALVRHGLGIALVPATGGCGLPAVALDEGAAGAWRLSLATPSRTASRAARALLELLQPPAGLACSAAA